MTIAIVLAYMGVNQRASERDSAASMQRKNMNAKPWKSRNTQITPAAANASNALDPNRLHAAYDQEDVSDRLDLDASMSTMHR